ncbi:MAG: hypothetical protein AB8G95_12400 [Anaerolineae bacterium]
MAYDLEQIRKLLSDAFSSGEIGTLAFDRFQEVYNDFASGMGKRQMIEAIVEHAHKRGQIPTMLDYIKKENSYQFGRYADKLEREEVEVIPVHKPDFGNTQRLNDLQGHIDREAGLLNKYREELTYEDDPRRRQKIEREITRQKETIAGYSQEAAELQAEISSQPTASTQTDAGQAQLNLIVEKIDTILQTQTILSDQVNTAESNLTSGQDKIRDEIGQVKTSILNRIDEQHKQTVGRLLGQMSDDQLEVTELIYDAADKQQLADWELGQLNLLTQQAVTDLQQLREGQPDGEQWADVLKALGGEASLTSKLHLTVPLIPLILSYEKELAIDVLPALKQTWQTAVSKIRNLR